MPDRNASNNDRALRIVVGILILSLMFVAPNLAWGLVGLVLVVTGIVGFCPLYHLLGIDTRHCLEA